MFKFKRRVPPPPFLSFSHRLEVLLPALLCAICLLVLPSSSTPDDESGMHRFLFVPVTFTAASTTDTHNSIKSYVTSDIKGSRGLFNQLHSLFFLLTRSRVFKCPAENQG